MSTITKYIFCSPHDSMRLTPGSVEYWMMYVSTGILNLWVNEMQYQVSNGSVAIIESSPNDVTIMPSGYVEAVLLELDKSEISKSVREHLALINEGRTLVKVVNTGKQQPYICSILQEMEAQKDKASDLLMELLVRLYRASMKSHLGTYRNSDECINRICMYLNKEYAQPLNLSEIAALNNMSASYLSHIFKTAMGVSIMQYVLSRRIDVACYYLEHTPIPIKDVAEKSGFNNVSNFGRTFKKETGFTPRQYRLSHNRRPEKLET